MWSTGKVAGLVEVLLGVIDILEDFHSPLRLVTVDGERQVAVWAFQSLRSKEFLYGRSDELSALRAVQSGFFLGGVHKCFPNIVKLIARLLL